MQHKPDEEKKMDTFKATMIAEGEYAMAGYVQGAQPTDEEIIEAWQLLHDTGLAYKMQGWFGRVAKSLLDRGMIQP